MYTHTHIMKKMNQLAFHVSKKNVVFVGHETAADKMNDSLF